jgi:hypothetical protein
MAGGRRPDLVRLDLTGIPRAVLSATREFSQFPCSEMNPRSADYKAYNTERCALDGPTAGAPHPAVNRSPVGDGQLREHERPPLSHQGAPASALCARPPSTREVGNRDPFSPRGARIARYGARRQSDQCGGASTTPPAVVADTTRRLWPGVERSRHRLPDDGRQCYPFLERGAQASFDGRHTVPQVSAPGRIRTSGLRIIRPPAVSAVLDRKIAGHS